MEELYHRLLSVPAKQLCSKSTLEDDYDSQLCDLVAYLRQLLGTLDSGISFDHQSQWPDPSIHSVSYLFMLHFQILFTQTRDKTKFPEDLFPGKALWAKIVFFLRNFDPFQISYVGPEWCRLLEHVKLAANAVLKPFVAVKLIREAIIRLDPSSSYLTPAHVMFLQLCLQTKSHIEALPIMDKHICNIPESTEMIYSKQRAVASLQHRMRPTFTIAESSLSNVLTYRDYLQYFSYGAMIYMVLKRWGDALHFLNIVVSIPVTSSISLIMVDAYKKQILASLQEHGKLPALPTTVTLHTKKLLRSLARPYVDLADAFEALDTKRMLDTVGKYRKVWSSDKNRGLVNQIVDAFHSHLLLSLGKTFAALNMTDIARLDVGEEPEPVVIRCIMSGALHGSLVQSGSAARSSMLRFTEKSVPFPVSVEEHIQKQLLEEQAALGYLHSSLWENNGGLESTAEFIQNMQRRQKTIDRVQKGSPILVEGLGNEFQLDEDMMEDMD
ncbi:hypothetical protein ASPZODRAFT_137582 [Penicilliopsis zonata CBS 506.65]|uniref:COP9 signalosome complex subunit 3 N-terminal helical repeats domain-containing protein n=1 Tax=Penicilliopsis zonata CBS 506.65 TaxID=1073090 RepID=A0A1L9S4A4_9EURO|nr:hypothetical protein ASPZODRAFT_137582 [Penicilliopsis zonata CBS 506.65]OJJ42001.1 hypothetical protein ASPZODRAFT_137582 [Penicilliopsis zonata CBS 506.65]